MEDYQKILAATSDRFPHNVLGGLEASYSYLTKLSGTKAILEIKVTATDIKISRVYFHHVAAQVTRRQIENITYVSHVL